MTTKGERSRRQAFLYSLPYVQRVPTLKLQRCEGIKWGDVHLKHLYAHGPRANPLPPEGIPEHAKCKKKGFWKFKALKNSHGRDGVYCLVHLYTEGITVDELERERTEKYWKVFLERESRTTTMEPEVQKA
jgi:hypothetical protein